MTLWQSLPREDCGLKPASRLSQWLLLGVYGVGALVALALLLI